MQVQEVWIEVLRNVQMSKDFEPISENALLEEEEIE